LNPAGCLSWGSVVMVFAPDQTYRSELTMTFVKMGKTGERRGDCIIGRKTIRNGLRSLQFAQQLADGPSQCDARIRTDQTRYQHDSQYCPMAWGGQATGKSNK